MHFFYRSVFKGLIFSGERVQKIFALIGEQGEGVGGNAQRNRKIGAFLNKKIAFR